MRYQTKSKSIPEETRRVAKAAFPKGNNYMTMRDELNEMYPDERLEELFSHAGRPGEAPGSLALISVMQYAEGLSDRQAVEAVRGRIDWKYALGLELEDPGFSHSVLSQFRKRLLAGGEEQVILEEMLLRFEEKGLLKTKGVQRTDSSHILAATRELNRLELVGETMRHLLEVLAVSYPGWLEGYLQLDWRDRYGPRFEEYRLPKRIQEREALAEAIGEDGAYLLAQLTGDPALAGIRQLPAVLSLSRIWIQQYYYQEGQLRWRHREQGFPPAAKIIQTPYDTEVRYSRKRNKEWRGYKVHLTETCNVDAPNLVTNVLTTPATTPDTEVIPTIHQSLVESDHAPESHLVDAGYTDTDNLVQSQKAKIDLVGPVQADSTWQGQDPEAFDLSTFVIDWDNQQVTCPNGKKSATWYPGRKSSGQSIIRVRFASQDCHSCSERDHCTKSSNNPRSLKFYSKAHHQTLQAARAFQETPAFKSLYQLRAGAEGTISQATRSFDLRRTRYIGLAKTHLHNTLVASAMNLSRVVTWLRDVPRAQTRTPAFVKLMPT